MRDVKGYERLYAVTSCGRVWSYKNKCFLKPISDKDGYLYVNLYKEKRMKPFRIHRLVSEAYIPNPENYPMINHKDENPSNNCLQNLEWCDAKYNNNYGTRIERAANSKKIPILQYDLNGNFIREWPSASDVGGEVESLICRCLKGRRKTAYNYIWKYKE